MYYIKVRTKYNEIKLILEDEDFYNENFQQLIQQEYVQQVYLRWIDEKEYLSNEEYRNIFRLEKKKYDGKRNARKKLI